MSKLNVDQKSIKDLFQGKNADFLIPDYQRPYAWGETECQTLWDDLFSFAFPDNDRTKFDRNNEYFLGPIVTFKNEDGKMEVIDGQQRLTTLMLLLRAFYARFGRMQDEESLSTKTDIEKCIWKTDEFGKPDMQALKIDSEVATDKNKEEFLEILRTGEADGQNASSYAQNYRFFQQKIEEFLQNFASYFPYMPTRILNNCILLPIEAESQDTALRIFSTLNDRGKPLSDADIFKAQFYKFYSKIGKKNDFVTQWKRLEETCERIFKTNSTSNTPMDELFTRYMYFVRAKQGIRSSTTEALRKFYEKDDYSLLKNEQTFEDLLVLAKFWDDVARQDSSRFSEESLRRLFVLNYAPNGMWTYFVSVYFMQNKKRDGLLEDEAFCEFLNKITAFIWTYAVVNPGVNALRTPIYAEMVHVVLGEPVTFSDFRFDPVVVLNQFSNFVFSNNRPITKSMLTWWAFDDERQELMPLETVLEVEHIFAKNRQEKEGSLQDSKSLELLGNKSILESRLNVRATDYRFADKKGYYLGTIKRNHKKEGTKVYELAELARNQEDFTEIDIKNRNKRILDGFIDYLRVNGLLID